MLSADPSPSTFLSSESTSENATASSVNSNPSSKPKIDNTKILCSLCYMEGCFGIESCFINRKTLSQHVIENHLLEVHQLITDQDGVAHCVFCDFTSSSEQSTIRHVDNEHSIISFLSTILPSDYLQYTISSSTVSQILDAHFTQPTSAKVYRPSKSGQK